MIRFATFNVAFDRTAPGMLSAELALDRAAQDALLARARHRGLSPAERLCASHVQQIRNVAEIIQRSRPDVLLLNEFDNDGTGDNQADLAAFNNNYLAQPQHPEVQAIHYPHRLGFATNTGQPSGVDLNLDGRVDGPDDAWGFGDYPGQYAFAVLSRYPIATPRIRTFQHFKWKEMPGEQNPVIDDDRAALPASRQLGEPWYDEAAWALLPLSSKNHADVPIRIATGGKEVMIHFLISHPTPPIFGNAARHNLKRNRAEIAFWRDYIDGLDSMRDDEGKAGGLTSGARFVIGGDLNADPLCGDGDRSAIRALLSHPLIHQGVSRGDLVPSSRGGPEHLETRPRSRHPAPAQITSSAGLRLDHLLPSANLTAIGSGVFWPASTEPGRHLVHDPRLGNAKGISSDHRLLWVDIKLD